MAAAYHLPRFLTATDWPSDDLRSMRLYPVLFTLLDCATSSTP